MTAELEHRKKFQIFQPVEINNKTRLGFKRIKAKAVVIQVKIDEKKRLNTMETVIQ